MNGGDRVEYLKRVLGIEVLYENKALEHLPNFISTRYDSQKVSLSGQKAVFFVSKNRIGAGGNIKKASGTCEKGCGLSGDFSIGTDHCTAERVFASRENSIYCGWKANLSALYGSIFAGTL